MAFKESARSKLFFHALTGVDPDAETKSLNTQLPQGKGGSSRQGSEPEPCRRDRIAALDVPALPLQLLARRHPDWIDRPMAVVAEDRPQGMVLWVNERAYRARVLPGMRYAAALSICGDLHAAEVPTDEIGDGVTELARLLRRFTPSIEPKKDEPGVFWLDATGLVGLETSLESWALRIRETLHREHFVANVVVGFSRLGAYALARSRRGVTVFDHHDAEHQAMRSVPLDRLHLDPKLRDHLMKLAVRDLGGLLDLPADGLGKRFGKDILTLHRLAAGTLPSPIDPDVPVDPVDAWLELEYPEADVYRLMFLFKRLLPALLERVAARAQGVAGLRIDFELDDNTRLATAIRTAEATLEEAQLIDLLRIKLETLELSAGVVEIRVSCDTVSVARAQLELFAAKERRDLPAAHRALARLRTEFGRDAVVRPRLRHAHLPEATFDWQPVDSLASPAPHTVGQRPLIRRIFDRPVALPHRGHHEPDGWLVRGPEQGPMVKVCGPFTVSGGWWVREVCRDYHFVETQKGDVMWVYYDRRRRRWFLQGQVE